MDNLDIVVFSDSHGNSARMRDIIDGTGADVVIHLGDGANDIESIEKTDRRRRLYIYVRGNCDFFSSDLPYTREFTLLGRKFLIMHGHTAGVKHGTAALEAIASDRGADIVMYGHTHETDDRFIPGEDGNGVYSANEFLTRINLMKAYRDDYATPIKHHKRVAVVGGGNVAMDAARCAARLGAEKVYIVYRRGENELPARREEVHHAKEEGIEFRLLTNPTKINTDENGNVCSVTCISMELGEPDASGRRRPVEIPGSEHDIDVDAVIIADGTVPNPLIRMTTSGLDTNRHGCIVTAEDGVTTTKEGVYAGGDAVTGAATVILAMGAGREAAEKIDGYLSAK